MKILKRSKIGFCLILTQSVEKIFPLIPDIFIGTNWYKGSLAGDDRDRQ
jgi:hypothetical protein